MSDKKLATAFISLIFHLIIFAFVLPFTRASDLLFITSYSLIYLLPIVFVYLISGKEFNPIKFKKLEFTDLYRISLFFLFFIVLSIILGFLFPDEIPEYEFSLRTLITAGILGPVLEELLWRGVVFASLSRYSAVFASIYSSLLFAMLHTGSSGLIYAFIGGMIFSFLYLKSGSLLPGIVLHLVNNLVSTLSPIFPLALRIALTLTLTVILLAKTKFKIYLKPSSPIKLEFDRRIFASPFIYITFIIVAILRYI